MLTHFELLQNSMNKSEGVEENQLGKEDELDELSDDELNTENNPSYFTTNGKWTTETLERVTAIIPRNDRFAEITSESNKKRKSNLRFWIAPIQFSKDNHQSDVIRVEDVKIPYCLETGYGTKFVYMCLPEDLRNLLINNKISDYNLNINESNLIGAGGWWKHVSSVKNKFGYVSDGEKAFNPLSLKKFFDEFSAGLTATLYLRLVCKASTDRMKELDNNVQRNLKVEVLQAYITSIDKDITQPFRRSPNVPKPLQKDVTPEKVKTQLFKMGLLKELKLPQKSMADQKSCNITTSA
ncbi:hypothetical protein GcM3_011008 [Golovinomyces cichoracearum]|uniref:Uncharacterized protein n=1 Tax=Golovinomyces cichoracearum TaxID=62708 RepID=A0A420J9U7_9PEZI|nr:hypothetical protein GcM3_011008 [Golovinomyces cichoracearum]